GELSIQMLVAGPIGWYFAKFLKPHISRLKYWLLQLVPITSGMTVLGASSRGAQVALAAQAVLEVLKRKNPIKILVIAAAVGAVGYHFLPEEQKARFESAGEDETSIQRLL